jgi:hypothetical protein
MKGVIAICLGEFVAKRFGKEKWSNILETAGLPGTTSFLPSQDVDDAAVLKVIRATCSVLSLSPTAAADAFGEYWCCEYAPRIYGAYYGKNSIRSAKDFLLRMQDVHAMVTRNIANAKPPQFQFEQPAPNKLIMKYISERGLGDIFAGLVKGVGRYFKEDLRIRRIGANAVEVTFAR